MNYLNLELHTREPHIPDTELGPEWAEHLETPAAIVCHATTAEDSLRPASDRRPNLQRYLFLIYIENDGRKLFNAYRN